ncbi:MAG: hypothetical protein K9K66_17430 [Desulfarculaceae bacterium]|nr:hypothetical protein [Desulfarculaceae bacterium]MCF8072539.1 hypothetical protein [Desulfarculaceae bacterium]MCF8103442.1 hypothetical protein [Desulfarculaceae bacterium]MCF8117080.1 hypothetical protein [Desulfarculaceae bacterium]
MRFLESGRSCQTPLALDLGRGWLAVSILGEELVTGVEPAAPVRRRWRLVDEAGGLHLLAPDPEGGWRVRPWGAGAAKV